MTEIVEKISSYCQLSNHSKENIEYKKKQTKNFLIAKTINSRSICLSFLCSLKNFILLPRFIKI